MGNFLPLASVFSVKQEARPYPEVKSKEKAGDNHPGKWEGNWTVET